MDPEKYAFFRGRLLSEKRRLESELGHLHKENSEVAESETSADQNFEDHMGDAASDMFDRERDLSLEQNVADMVGQVDSALLRIEDGTYGFCSACHKPINEERLEALPYTDLCLEDKEREEGLR